MRRSVNFVPHPRYGPPLVGADTKTRPEPAPKIKFMFLVFFFWIYTRNGYRKVSFILGFELFASRYSARMKYGLWAGPEMARKPKSGPGNQKKPETRKLGCCNIFGMLQGFQNYFYFIVKILSWRDWRASLREHCTTMNHKEFLLLFAIFSGNF